MAAKTLSINCQPVWKAILLAVWGTTHMIINCPKMGGWQDLCLECGWSLSRGKWLAETQMYFCWWIKVLPLMTVALSWDTFLLYLLLNTTSYMEPLDQGIINCMTWECWRHVLHFLLQGIRMSLQKT